MTDDKWKELGYTKDTLGPGQGCWQKTMESGHNIIVTDADEKEMYPKPNGPFLIGLYDAVNGDLLAYWNIGCDHPSAANGKLKDVFTITTLCHIEMLVILEMV